MKDARSTALIVFAPRVVAGLLFLFVLTTLPFGATATRAIGQSSQGPVRPAVVQEGWAMPYPDVDRPRKTASGATYDPAALTAAHRTLPIGTSAELTSLESGRQVVVRINDRGPYVPDRILDISDAAARALGFGDEGGRVKLRVVSGRVTADAEAAISLAKEQPVVKQPDARPQTGEFTVQLGSFEDEAGARKIADSIEGAWIYRIRVDEKAYYRVNFGVFASSKEAERFRLRLAERDISGFVKAVEEHEKRTVID